MTNDADDLALPEPLPADPMPCVERWLSIATARKTQPNPNAMSLCTVDAEGNPSVRIVLCKEFVASPGYLVFYTNYESAKGDAIRSDPRVAAVFHWDALGRQVRLEGHAVMSPAEESDAYFATRHPGSQVGAWGSDQSQPISSRSALLQQLAEREAKLDGDAIPRPPHWGGYRLWPTAVELWLEGADRVHDRVRWTRSIERSDEHHFAGGEWTSSRLQP